MNSRPGAANQEPALSGSTTPAGPAPRCWWRWTFTQCWDNALSESFFASLKGELTDTRPWPTRAAAIRAVVEYIGWYNGTRLHSTLGYRSPAEFEEHNKIKKVA